MSAPALKVGQIVTASRDIPLVCNVHVAVLGSATPAILPKGTEAEILAIAVHHVDLNCKDGHGFGPSAWGLKIRIAKVVWWNSFA